MSTTHEYEDLKSRMSELSVGINQLKDQNRMMMDLLKGNPLDRKSHGMIGELHDLSADVEFLMQERKKLKWTVAGAMAAGGCFFAVITFIAKHLFKF